MTSWLPFAFAALALAAPALAQKTPAKEAPYLNTWLVAGPYDNGADGAGMARDSVGEASVAPKAGGEWRVFDDRLFNRNYDNYQDLFSYYNLKRGESIAAKLAYAHVYLYSPAEAHAELRMAADSEMKAWLNGAQVLDHARSEPHRDAVKVAITLAKGWNRLLVKVGNRLEGRLGFYARVCLPNGGPVPGIIASTGGPAGSLAVASRPMADIKTPGLPAAFRGWPYVETDALAHPDPDIAGLVNHRAYQAMQSSAFVLSAQGGKPPYRWALTNGTLPKGLKLLPDGTIGGTVSDVAGLGDRALTFTVTDAAGKTASAQLTMPVDERPSRWYGEAGLVALMHAPEYILDAPEGDLAEFAHLMKRQGYSLGMMISYNNGDMMYRFPSRFEPNCPFGDLPAKYKAALGKEGIKFGLYMGNLIGPNHGGDDGALLMVTDAVKKYRPAAMWFDWASPQVWGYISLDALYSAIKTINPDTVIVINGVVTCYQGDWDAICLEGWGAWGDRIWALWPFAFNWPKKPVVESWRMLADPANEYSKGILPDWQEYMRVAISLIGCGWTANLDHSASVGGRYKTLYDSVVARAHRDMANWANPPGLPPLHTAYTHVTQAPVEQATWGYALLSTKRDAVYLHCLKNPYGKTGLPASTLAVGPLHAQVRSVVCMNTGKAARFEMKGDRLTVHTAGIAADPVDTIFRVELVKPLPAGTPTSLPTQVTPPGNLAFGKPARLLSIDGSHDLVPSAFSMARFGVDGSLATHAQGAYEWAWMYHVDLQKAQRVSRIVIHFTPKGYATEYEVLVSADGSKWDKVADVKGSEGGDVTYAFAPRPVRCVRVRAVKPDGPDQEGGQMGIAELEVYK